MNCTGVQNDVPFNQLTDVLRFFVFVIDWPHRGSTNGHSRGKHAEQLQPQTSCHAIPGKATPPPVEIDIVFNQLDLVRQQQLPKRAHARARNGVGRIAADAVQFVVIAGVLQVEQLVHSSRYRRGQVCMQFPSLLDQPEKQGGIVEMPHQPARQVFHDAIVSAAAPGNVGERHVRGQVVGGRSSQQAELQRLVRGRFRWNTETNQVGVSEIILGEWL